MCLQARLMNASGLFDPPLPSLHPDEAFVYLPHDKEHYTNQWIQAYLHVTSGGARLEYKDTFGANMNPNNWVCFKRAVMTGTIGGVVRDACTLL